MNNNNVLPFPRRHAAADKADSQISLSDTAAAFDALTVQFVMDRARRGQLEPDILSALLQGCGFNVEAPQ